MKVFTTKGLVDYEALEVKDIVSVTDNSRAVASEFYLNGELVRRDVAVSMLRPIEAAVEHGSL